VISAPRLAWSLWGLCVGLTAVGLGFGGWVSQWIGAVTFPVLLRSMLLGLVALTVRFRRAAAVERLQLKWLVYVAGSS